MELSIPRPQPRKEGDYETFVDCGYGKPWAIIHLAENGTLDLRDLGVDDCDRLIKAAVEVKSQLLRFQAEMTAPHGRGHLYKGTCQLCGKPEDDVLHADPDACGDCGRLVCDCAAGMGEDPTDSIAAGHDADAAAALAASVVSVVLCGLPVWGDEDRPCGLIAGHGPVVSCPGMAALLEDAAAHDADAAAGVTGTELVLCQAHGGEFGPADCDKCAADAADVLLAAAELDIEMREPAPGACGNAGPAGLSCTLPRGHEGPHHDGDVSPLIESSWSYEVAPEVTR